MGIHVGRPLGRLQHAELAPQTLLPLVNAGASHNRELYENGAWAKRTWAMRWHSAIRYRRTISSIMRMPPIAGTHHSIEVHGKADTFEFVRRALQRVSCRKGPKTQKKA